MLINVYHCLSIDALLASPHNEDQRLRGPPLGNWESVYKAYFRGGVPQINVLQFQIPNQDVYRSHLFCGYYDQLLYGQIVPAFGRAILDMVGPGFPIGHHPSFLHFYQYMKHLAIYYQPIARPLSVTISPS